MKKIMNWIRNDKVRNILMAVDMVIMLFLLYLYLMYADLSTAPEFIYSQF